MVVSNTAVMIIGRICLCILCPGLK